MHHRAVTEREILSVVEAAFLATARTAVLATTPGDGPPRLVPICFVLSGSVVYTPLDEKPKRVRDPHDLERVRDIVANPVVGLLVDRWSEEWSRLGWLRLSGRAVLIEPSRVEPPASPTAAGAAAALDEHSAAVAALRAKYSQYLDHRLEDRPIIRIVLESARSWGDLSLP
jgi:PPOX class probable F420-dependent enzyme